MFPGDPQNGKLHKTASALRKRQTVKLLCHYVCLPTEGLDVLLKDAFTSAQGELTGTFMKGVMESVVTFYGQYLVFVMCVCGLIAHIVAAG